MSVPSQPSSSPPTSHSPHASSGVFTSSFATFLLEGTKSAAVHGRKYFVFTSSDPSADSLSVTFASHRIVLAYNGSFSSLRPAGVREGDKAIYASYIFAALQRQHTSETDAKDGQYGYEWRDATRSSAPRATLTIARTFDQYTVNIAIINLAPVVTASSSTSSSPLSSTYSRSLFPLLHSVRTGLVELQSRDRRARERLKRQQEQLDVIDQLLEDKTTEAGAIEEEWLAACMRLVNAEKAKIREMRAKTDRVKRETQALTAKVLPAAKGRLSESDSDSEEEKDESKAPEAEDVAEMKEDEAVAAAMDAGPALNDDSGAMELSLHPDSSLPPSSFTSMPSLQPDSDVSTQRSSSTGSSLTSSNSLSRMSDVALGSGDTGRRSVRKRARLRPAALSTASIPSSESSPSVPAAVSLSSSLNGSTRLVPPLSSAGGKTSAVPTVRAPSPAATVGTAADGRLTSRQGVTALFDEM